MTDAQQVEPATAAEIQELQARYTAHTQEWLASLSPREQAVMRGLGACIQERSSSEVQGYAWFETNFGQPKNTWQQRLAAPQSVAFVDPSTLGSFDISPSFAGLASLGV